MQQPRGYPPRPWLREANGQRLEPIEEILIDADDMHTGGVVQKLTERKGELVDMRPPGTGRPTQLRYVAALLAALPSPTREEGVLTAGSRLYCFPIIRTLIYVPAGLAKMNFAVFALFSAFGMLAWNTVSGFTMRGSIQ